MKKLPLSFYLRKVCAKIQLRKPIIPLSTLPQSLRTNKQTNKQTHKHSEILAQLKLRILLSKNNRIEIYVIQWS